VNMKSKNNISFQTQGTSNLTRFKAAIDPSYFGIDERSLTDILSYILDYSKNLRYVNSSNEIVDDWSPFLENNLAFVIAIIASEDLNSFNERFKLAVKEVEGEIQLKDKLARLETLLGIIFELFKLVDRWYKLSRHDLIHLNENKLVEHLQNAIKTKLGYHLADFKSLINDLDQTAYPDKKLDLDFGDFDYTWDIDSDQFSGQIKEKLFELKIVIKEASRIFKSVISVSTYIKNLAPDLLNYSLDKYPYHEPHISLLIAFVKAFQHTKQDANDLTKKHLDYYYKDILKQEIRDSEPDKAHVYFDPADHIVKSVIPAGTLLSAGIDEEGRVYTYATDQNLELNKGQISDVKTIHVAKNSVIGFGNTFTSVSNIYSRKVNLNENGIALNKSNNPEAFDTFGKDQVDLSYPNRDMEQAQIGFAVSSSVLVLHEGERNINLKYTFNLNSLSSLISFIEELTTKENLSPENAFYKLLNNIFTLRYTSDSGWYEIENYEILPPRSWTSGEIRIEMTLDVADPAMIPFNDDLHGMGYESKWPVLEFTLSSKHAMYAYSYLKDLLIEQCEINVDVKKVKDLQLFNDLGKLDITKPFYPFGSTPDLGSYFLVGNEEMITKRITDLSLDIQWHNLPKVKGGLKTYYQDYPGDISTDSFKVGITYLSDFRFHPIDENDIQKINLFEEDTTKNKIKDERRFRDLDLEKLEFKPNFKLAELSDYSSKTRSGFFKLEIMEPESGFGYSEYSKLFAKAVIENSKSAGLLSKETKSVELPNEPYAPQIRTISLNYSAQANFIMNVNKVSENDKLSHDQVCHLHPFGNKVVFERGLPESNALLPQYEDEGYLLIGLEDIQAPVELSLYFELEDNIKNDTNHTEIPNAKWKYLVDDSWVEFEENEVVFDGTNNFTTSGIIKLQIPSNINTKHRILPSQKYWLSVSTEFNTEIVSKTILIKTNGASVTWKARERGEQWMENSVPNTISGFLQTRTDVNGVNQPFPTFGGRFVESNENFYTRVSERLKHKNRAITPDDFEKIILDQFPFIFQVKCLNHFSHPDSVKKGHVKLILVHKIEKKSSFYPPKVNYNQLEKIQKHMQQMTSPYTTVEVINPSYEKVKVSVKVIMKDSTKAGEYVKRLADDLKKFICPWFDVDQGEMSFGGNIERDDILSFIESLDYVHFITKLSVILLHQVNGKYDISDSASNDGKNNKLVSSSPWSVLIPSENHEIELIDKPTYEVAQETRIETMKIGDDFIIIDEKNEEMEFPHFDLDKDTFYAIEINL